MILSPRKVSSKIPISKWRLGHRYLPKLEGTTHVNMALIIKFIKNYFFDKADFEKFDSVSSAKNDSYLFNQVSGSLAKVRFPDYRRALRDSSSLTLESSTSRLNFTVTF